MGLRHRTPISLVRDYRRRAAIIPKTRVRPPSLQTETSRSSPRYSALRSRLHGQGAAELRWVATASETPAQPERLLHRLRDILAPHSAGREGSHRAECESLELEIAQIAEAQRNLDQSRARDDAPPIRELFLPHGPPSVLPPEAVGPRTLQVSITAAQGIIRLTESLADLTFYQQALPARQVTPGDPPALTLVGEPKPEPPLAEEEALGAETASITQCLLDAARKKTAATQLPRSLLLSLLD